VVGREDCISAASRIARPLSTPPGREPNPPAMSLAPVAPLKLARFPVSLVATSRLYLLCRLPQSLHSLRDSLKR